MAGLMEGHAITIAAAYYPPCCVYEQGFQPTPICYLQALSAFNSLLGQQAYKVCTQRVARLMRGHAISIGAA